ncbi:hypothetical protein QL285_064592 [Trifolium repens]|nr:hypothetical protein QL285_064592 [Trifolium repens]
MDNNSSTNNVAGKSKSQRGEKKLDASVSKSRRTTASRKIKEKAVVVLPSSSSSYDTDEDYAEFLKTYDPQELSSSSSDDIDEDYAEFLKTYVLEELDAYGSPPGEEEGSQIIVESVARTPAPSKVKSSK